MVACELGSVYDVSLYFQVKEHLEIYAILKGVQEDIVEVVVNDMIDEVCSNHFCGENLQHNLHQLDFPLCLCNFWILKFYTISRFCGNIWNFCLTNGVGELFFT